MRVLHDECIIHFNDTNHIVKSDTSLANIFCNSKTIIDNTLLYFNPILILLHYFSCVAQFFSKYILYFKLIECDIFLPRVEYVRHDLIAGGNCSEQSKFQLIKNWPLPPHDLSLLSFIGLCSFHSNHVPWFESNIKPLRRLQRFYHRQSLPILAWLPPLVELFKNIQIQLHYLTSPPPI